MAEADSVSPESYQKVRALIYQLEQEGSDQFESNLPLIAAQLKAKPQLLYTSIAQDMSKLAKSTLAAGLRKKTDLVLSILIANFYGPNSKAHDLSRNVSVMKNIIELEMELDGKDAPVLVEHALALLRAETGGTYIADRGEHSSRWVVMTVLYPAFQILLEQEVFSEARKLLQPLMLLLQKVYGRRTSVIDFFMEPYCQALRSKGRNGEADSAERHLRALNLRLDVEYGLKVWDTTFPKTNAAIDYYDLGKWHTNFCDYKRAVGYFQMALDNPASADFYDLWKMIETWARIEFTHLNNPEKAIEITCDQVDREKPSTSSFSGTLKWAESYIWIPAVKSWVTSGEYEVALKSVIRIYQIMCQCHEPYSPLFIEYTKLTKECLEHFPSHPIKGEVDSVAWRQQNYVEFTVEYSKHTSLGYDHMKNEDYSQAIIEFEQAVSIAPTNPYAREFEIPYDFPRPQRQMAMAYLKLGKIDQAEAIVTEAAELLVPMRRTIVFILTNIFLLELQIEIAELKEDFAKVNLLATNLIADIMLCGQNERCESNLWNSAKRSNKAIKALMDCKDYRAAFRETVRLLETLEQHFPEARSSPWLPILLERLANEAPSELLNEEFRRRIEELRS